MSAHPRTVYLDHNATTPCDPRVVDAMLPWFTENFGNPSSAHHPWGARAEAAVEAARAQVAAMVGVAARNTIFVSGATEGLNLAIENLASRRTRLLVSMAEHSAVLEAARAAEGTTDVVWLRVDGQGHVDLAAAEQAMADGVPTALVAMAANNEVGTIARMVEIQAACRRHDALHLCDAVQLAGWQPISLAPDVRTLVVVSGHKLYGPKGAAALCATHAADLGSFEPRIRGGKQERGLRGGTHNVPAIVGLGAAAVIAHKERESWTSRVGPLRDQLQAALAARIPHMRVNGDLERRLPNNLHVSFEDVEADALLTCLPDVAVSTGSACHSGAVGPSHVLRAMGMDDNRAYGALRLGLGRSTTDDDLEYAATRIAAEVAKQREA